MGKLRLAAGLAAAPAAAWALAGCGPIGSGPAAADQAHTLTIYSSLPVQGPDQARQQSIVNGEKLALAEVGGRVGPFHVSFASLTDSNPRAGSWTVGDTLAAARAASSDRSTIAYLGDFDSPATAISLPLLNEGGILQVGLSSTFPGLTQAGLGVGRGEPERYYPSAGPRTFARLMPSDTVQAVAMIGYMKRLGVRRLFVIGAITPSDTMDAALAAIVSARAPAVGVPVVGRTQVEARPGPAEPVDPRRAVAAVRATRADAVLLAGAGAGLPRLWRALHAAAPRAKLFAGSSLASPVFAAATSRAASVTYLISPVLLPRLYPLKARRVLRDYRTSFGLDPTPYSLYGYEAMRSTLAAIAVAGKGGGDRARVVRAYFDGVVRDSVLGRYSLTPTGETTLANMAGYRVGSDGRLRFDRLLSGGR